MYISITFSLDKKMLGYEKGKYDVLHHHSWTVDPTMRRKALIEICLV